MQISTQYELAALPDTRSMSLKVLHFGFPFAYQFLPIVKIGAIR